MDDPTTIIAVCTPRGHGGVGLVRLSGPQSVAISSNLFASQQSLRDQPRHVTFGHIVDALQQPVDTALAWFMPGPHSYTGEDVVELSSHGSEAVLELIVDRGVECGARLAEPGEFTRRAFLNGRMDLMQAEAVADLIQARGSSSLSTAYGVLGGDLSSRVSSLRDRLVDALARLETQLDFVEDVSAAEAGDLEADLAWVQSTAEQLVASFSGARSRLTGFRVVLVGEPNVGKSTLFNALIGAERSIVTDVPGTTRDWVEAVVVWEGESIRLVDTAGLRDTEDPAERAGVERTHEQLEGADLAVYISDRSDETRKRPDGPSLTVHSKADIARPHAKARDAVAVSAHTGEGLAELRQEVLRRVTRANGPTDAGPTRERHREALEAIAKSVERARGRLQQDDAPELAASDLRTAVEHTGAMLGIGTDDAILDRIFSQFCIGK